MSQRLVYFNGNFIPEREARISIFDNGIMYGDICFELTRSFKQKPYRLRDHLDRLYDSLAYTEIDCGLSKDEMEAVSLELVERSFPALADFEFHLYHQISRGGMGLYEELIDEGTDPIVAINIYPIVRTLGRVAKRYEEGAHFVTPKQQSIPWYCLSPRAKTHSRLHYKLADLEVSRMGEDLNTMLTDERGFLTEGTGNNFFMVRGGQIMTPKVHNILFGIGRKACLEIIEGLGMSVVETDISPYDVLQASEAWSTSTTICMTPITRFNFKTVGDGKPGPVYKKLYDAWCEEVGLDIAGQARSYGKIVDTWKP